jgi:hypothetical protein
MGRVILLPKAVPTYPTAIDLPGSAAPGDIATLENGDIYTWDGSMWNLVAYGAGLNSFTTIQVPQGTSPVADGPADTLTLTSLDESIDIVGNATTDTIDFSLNLNYNIDGGQANSVYTNTQFIDGGNASSF